MKKIVTGILLFSTLVGCKSATENNLIKMKASVEKSLNDNAFKENYKLNIMELKAISYDTVSENMLDTLLLIKYSDKMDHFLKLTELTLDQARDQGKNMRLYAMINSKTLTDMAKEDFDKLMEEAQNYQDSIKFYSDIDSITRNRIKARLKPNDIYRAKFFLKATVNKENKSENFLDTVNYYFDKDLKILDLRGI